MRIRPLALSVVALSAILLTGCAGTADPDASPSAAPGDLCSAAAPSGAASEAVTVDGEIGQQPTAAFTSPLDIPAAQRTVLVEGEGDPVADGEFVRYALTAYSADTGALLGAVGYNEGELLPQAISPSNPLGTILGCATPGTRVVATFPKTDSTNAEVYVVDLLGVTPQSAWGEPQAPVDGMPTVTLDDDGMPSVEIPDADAPSDLQIAVLKKGDGPAVADGGTALVQYYGVSWDTKENFDSSWKRAAPVPFATNAVYEGFGKALVGQSVGSQVLVVMPPEMGDLNGDLKGQTLVFVIDILATQNPVAQ